MNPAQDAPLPSRNADASSTSNRPLAADQAMPIAWGMRALQAEPSCNITSLKSSRRSIQHAERTRRATDAAASRVEKRNVENCSSPCQPLPALRACSPPAAPCAAETDDPRGVNPDSVLESFP